jgi:hypothetical protein
VALPFPNQRPKKLALVHSILKRLASIDKNYGHLIVVLQPQFGVGVDVYLTPLKIGLALEPGKCLLDYVAEMASITRIHHHVVHRESLTANVNLAVVIDRPEHELESAASTSPIP